MAIDIVGAVELSRSPTQCDLACQSEQLVLKPAVFSALVVAVLRGKDM